MKPVEPLRILLRKGVLEPMRHSLAAIGMIAAVALVGCETAGEVEPVTSRESVEAPAPPPKPAAKPKSAAGAAPAKTAKPRTEPPPAGGSFPGARLPEAHVVKVGEDIYGIAEHYGIDAYALAMANNMSPPFTVHPGERLRLPADEATAGRATGEAPPGDAQPPPPKPRDRSTVETPPPPAVMETQAGFLWPVAGRVISDFGPKGQGLRNDGINIAAPAGTPVRATEGGVVTYAGNELRSFGNILLVKHSGGWVSAYAHNEALLVGRGAKVTKGQAIARVGRTGDISEPQLHFQLRKNGKPVDPVKYLARPAT